MDINDRFIADCQIAAKKGRRPDEEASKSQGQGVIRDAESNKGRLFATPGNSNLLEWGNVTDDAVRSFAYDDNYLVIGAHVEASLQHKIINHEYCDFAKLIPKGRVTKEEDNRLEIVSRGGPPSLFQFLTVKAQ